MLSFQEIISKLYSFWSGKGCPVLQPYDLEMGAATFHPATCLRSLGPDAWKAVYVQPCRRPSDGRFGKNPNRLQHYYQMQAILKPSPRNSQDLFLESLNEISIDPSINDIKFIEDDWESPTLGAAGMGWEVQCNGMEICQFTYFQQVGGIECSPVSVEFTYGLERIAMYIQGVESVFEIAWDDKGTRYSDLFLENEVQFSEFNYKAVSSDLLFSNFNKYERDCIKLIKKKLTLPAYEYCIKASHIFNLLDSRALISVSERQAYILKVRNLAKLCCESWISKRKND
tara:strand:+ start:450 stop:1304 length:855 start_codon:yes stop_codon:yes gene_type:complete